MTYTIIGSGNMAWFLATRLSLAKHTCLGMYSRNTEAAATIAERFGMPNFATVAELNDTPADVCLLAVADDAIRELAPQLQIPDAVLIHTSGTTPLSALAPATANAGVIWPVYSISRQALPMHREIPCAWDVAGTEKARATVAHVINSITDAAFQANDEQRLWLHLAAVVGNNFTNHLMTICETICTQQQLPFAILQPILQQTFERISQHSPAGLQTGPAARNDVHTMEKHEAMLAGQEHWQAVYKALSASIIAQQKQAGG